MTVSAQHVYFQLQFGEDFVLWALFCTGNSQLHGTEHVNISCQALKRIKALDVVQDIYKYWQVAKHETGSLLGDFYWKYLCDVIWDGTLCFEA